MTWNTRKLAVLALILLSSSLFVGGRSVTVPVGRLGEEVPPEVAESHGWPEGTLALVNHPLRHTGWKNFFNTDPADQTTFVFIPRSTKELKTIVKLFARIADNKGWVALDPRPCQPHSFEVPIKEEMNAAAVFTLGSQKAIDAWYAKLTVNAKGERLHNGGPLTKAMGAMPPILTIFADNKAIDLSKLKLPKQVPVVAGISKEHRAAHPDDPVVKAIDELVARHKAKGGKTTPPFLQEPAAKAAPDPPQSAPDPPAK